MSVKVVIIGAGGLVGSRLSDLLVTKEKFNISPTEQLPLSNITLFDVNEKFKENMSKQVQDDGRVKFVAGDLCDNKTITSLLDPEGCTRVTTIHLAALLSGYSEDNFDLGMKINLYGTLNVMQVVRALSEKLGSPQIYVYCSTDYVACFNEYNKTHVVTEESFRLSPVSYGCQKACNELLICDYTRKGFLDGRVTRLSAVIGRPGWSNSISYPYTGIFTQPLEGKDYEVSLPMDIPYPISSLDTNVASLLFAASEVDGVKLGHNRVIQVACKSVTLSDIWAATQVVAKEQGITLGKVTQVAADKGTTTVTEINVCPHVSCEKAVSLGMPSEVDLNKIILDYINRYIKK